MITMVHCRFLRGRGWRDQRWPGGKRTWRAPFGSGFRAYTTAEALAIEAKRDKIDAIMTGDTT